MQNKKLKKTNKIQLIERKEVWVITWQGWVILIISLIVSMVLIIGNIYPFLAVNAPVKPDVLVVEGWLPDYAVESAIAEFKTGKYRKLITTGLPIGKGYYLAQYKNYAELTAASFIALGFDKNKLIAVPAPNVIKYRTTASAIALKDWLSTSDLKVKSINIYTLGAHARRSWMLFKAVLSPEIEVGVIAGKAEDYDRQLWWQSSAGFRTVIDETIAYIYATFVGWKA